MNSETTATGIAPEMTIPDAVKIARQEAAKNTGEVRSALTMLADYAMPLIPHDEPAAENGELKMENVELPPKPERGKIGIKSNRDAILVWNLADGLDVVVSGQRLNDASWNVQLQSHGISRASMIVFGGRQTAANLCMALRNGMTRHCMKIKSNHANRKAKEAQA
ncbi:MAG: hypothetical protein IKO72_09000 [Kiritimatiellae bacterium]|nr:hypothetical protein [Kiritimatiellia bacterium]